MCRCFREMISSSTPSYQHDMRLDKKNKKICVYKRHSQPSITLNFSTTEINDSQPILTMAATKKFGLPTIIMSKAKRVGVAPVGKGILTRRDIRRLNDVLKPRSIFITVYALHVPDAHPSQPNLTDNERNTRRRRKICAILLVSALALALAVVAATLGVLLAPSSSTKPSSAKTSATNASSPSDFTTESMASSPAEVTTESMTSSQAEVTTESVTSSLPEATTVVSACVSNGRKCYNWFCL